MRKYIVKYLDHGFTGEIVMTKPFDDVQFKDQYVIATDDETDETLYIPYYKIYNMKLIKQSVEIDPFHP